MRATVPSAVVAIAAAACLAPAVASAQVPAARVVLYEVSESLKLTTSPSTHWTSDTHRHDGQSDGDDERTAETRRAAHVLSRLANAALLGNNILAWDPSTVFAAASYMTSTAVSDVSLDPNSPAFGTGPISGNFNVAVYQDLTGQRSLSNLVVVGSGRLRGVLDLRAALNPDPTQRQPLAPVSGQWTTAGARRGSGRDGTFSGVFLIPFQLPTPLVLAIKSTPGGPDLTGVTFYLNPTQLGSGVCAAGDNAVMNLPVVGLVCPVSPDEHVLGFPLTKAVIVLFD